MTTTGLLSAEWRDLVMISYEIDPLLLVRYVPAGTSLDFHDGRTIVTVVGLRMLNARVGDVALPMQQQIERVTFRFYVWRRVRHEVRRGVVFIKEIVPTASLTFGAPLFFSQHFFTAPMRHRAPQDGGGVASYEWHAAGRWNRVAARQQGEAGDTPAGSLETFVKDRAWGYARQRDGSTLEYHMEHPEWAIRAVSDPVLDCDVAQVFGRQFAPPLAAAPICAFVAVGSEATLHPGRALD